MEKFVILKNIGRYYDDGYVLNIRKDNIQFHDAKNGWMNAFYTQAFEYLNTNNNYLSMQQDGEDFFMFRSPLHPRIRMYSLRKDVNDILISNR